MSVRTRILLVGVGGHGVVTAARMLGEAGRELGIPTRIGQIHGMSQRGGSVESTVVFGPGQTALVGDGEADVVLGFEPLETARAMGRMSPRTMVVANCDRVSPYDMSRRGDPYPDLDELFASVAKVASRVVVTDALKLAQTAGDARTLGAVLIGAAMGLGALPFESSSMLAAIERACPPAALEANRRAFASGVAAGAQEAQPTEPQAKGQVTT